MAFSAEVRQCNSMTHVFLIVIGQWSSVTQRNKIYRQHHKFWSFDRKYVFIIIYRGIPIQFAKKKLALQTMDRFHLYVIM